MRQSKKGTGFEPQCSGAKVCRICELSKHVLEFSHNSKNKDGLTKRCRVCKDKSSLLSNQRRHKDNSRGPKYLAW